MSEKRKHVIGKKDGNWMVFAYGADIGNYNELFQNAVEKLHQCYGEEEIPVSDIVADHILQDDMFTHEEAIGIIDALEKRTPSIREDAVARLKPVFVDKSMHDRIMNFPMTSLKYVGVTAQTANVMARRCGGYIKDMFDLNRDGGCEKLIYASGVSTRSLAVLYGVLAPILTVEESRNLQNAIHYRSMVKYKTN